MRKWNRTALLSFSIFCSNRGVIAVFELVEILLDIERPCRMGVHCMELSYLQDNAHRVDEYTCLAIHETGDSPVSVIRRNI